MEITLFPPPGSATFLMAVMTDLQSAISPPPPPLTELHCGMHANSTSHATKATGGKALDLGTSPTVSDSNPLGK